MNVRNNREINFILVVTFSTADNKNIDIILYVVAKNVLTVILKKLHSVFNHITVNITAYL